MYSSSHQLFICPDWYVQAVLDNGDPLESLLDITYVSNRFTLADVAFAESFRKHHGVERIFGEYFSAHSYAKNEAEAIEGTRVWSAQASPVLKKEVDEYLNQDITLEGKQSGMYRIFHLRGVTVLAVKPGFLKACENNNFLLPIFRAVADHAMKNESMKSLLNYS